MSDFWENLYEKEKREKEKWKAKYETARRMKLCELHNEIYKLHELHAEIEYPEELVVKSDSIHEILNRDLASKIAEEAIKYMEIFTQYDPSLQRYVVKARLKVVDK